MNGVASVVLMIVLVNIADFDVSVATDNERNWSASTKRATFHTSNTYCWAKHKVTRVVLFIRKIAIVLLVLILRFSLDFLCVLTLYFSFGNPETSPHLPIMLATVSDRSL